MGIKMIKKIKYRELKSYKFELSEGYIIQTELKPSQDIFEPNEESPLIVLSKNGLLCIAPGYAWDGASGFFTVQTKNFLRGSLVHDALYQLMRQKKLRVDNREYADKLLKEIVQEDGMSNFRAWYVYQAVRKFGESSAMPRDKEEIQEIVLSAP